MKAQEKGEVVLADKKYSNQILEDRKMMDQSD
jgi:hypothetical protein